MNARRVVPPDRLRYFGSAADTPDRRHPNLTPREREILIAWIHDDNKDAVARRFSISAATVRSVVQRVRVKYAAVGRPAPTKAALVARALQDGLVKIDDL